PPGSPVPGLPRALAAGPMTGPAARGSVGERTGRDVGDPFGGLVEVGVAVLDLPRQRDGPRAAELAETLDGREQNGRERVGVGQCDVVGLHGESPMLKVEATRTEVSGGHAKRPGARPGHRGDEKKWAERPKPPRPCAP